MVLTPSSPSCSETSAPTSASAVISSRAARATSTVVLTASRIQVVGDLAQNGGDLRAVRLVWIAAAAQSGADAVEQLDQVFDHDRHVVGRAPRELAQTRGGIEHPHRERLGALLAVGDAELEAAARAHDGARRKRRSVQEDLLAVVGRDEAEAFVFVVELDLAGGHGDLSLECWTSGRGAGPILVLWQRTPVCPSIVSNASWPS